MQPHADTPQEPPRIPDLGTYDAILFDLDGVITPTATLHQQAWAKTFSQFFASDTARSAAQQIPKQYEEQDYYDYLDGRPRLEGIQEILQSRGIELPLGNETDGSDTATVNGLGNWKNEEFLRMLDEGIQAYPGSVELIDALGNYAAKQQPAAPRLAIVSSSKNAPRVLNAAGLDDRFELIIDGNVAAEKQLSGKPAPDTYLYAAKKLDCSADRTVVLEDALSGVASGKNGKFGLVIGVNRGAGRKPLLNNGANIVVDDLAELAAALGTKDN